MEQLLVINKPEWENWKRSLGHYSGIMPDEPKSYPCMISWYSWDVRGQNSDRGVYSYVYPSDFAK